MASSRQITIYPPVGGLVKRYTYQQQPPYTTPRCLNVWPIEPFEIRQRTGRRSGLTKQATTAAGSSRFRAVIPVPAVDEENYAYRLMCCTSNDWYYPVAGAGMTTFKLDGMTSTTGRVPWAVFNSIIYLLDGTTLRTLDPWDASPSIDNVVASAGTIPTNCNLLAAYAGRLVMAQRRGHQWNLSKVGDWTNWDTGADPNDPVRAFSGATSDIGELQEPLNALAPWGDEFMLMGCDNSIWNMTGDPGYGGKLFPVSRQIGVIGPDAWCFTPERYFLFLDWSGMYMIPPGGTGDPVPFSREKLPSDLRNIDPVTYDCVLRFDPQHNGMLLAIMPITGSSELGAGEHWWIDWPTQSFWKLQFPAGEEPRFYEQFAFATGYDHSLFMGCDDSYLKAFDDTAPDDDGTDITAYLDIGPIRISGDEYSDGVVQQLTATLAGDSADVTWNLFVGADAEAAADAASGTADSTGTWSAGRNYWDHPRKRGGAFILQLSGSGQWALESVHAVLLKGGKQRLF
ncbi:MAG: hypothetical protein V1755_06710 [Chloroflexota bacterium]